MDLFEIRSTMMDNFVDDLKNTRVNLEDYQRELEVMTLQGMYSVETDLFLSKDTCRMSKKPLLRQENT